MHPGLIPHLGALAGVQDALAQHLGLNLSLPMSAFVNEDTPGSSSAHFLVSSSSEDEEPVKAPLAKCRRLCRGPRTRCPSPGPLTLAPFSEPVSPLLTVTIALQWLYHLLLPLLAVSRGGVYAASSG